MKRKIAVCPSRHLGTHCCMQARLKLLEKEKEAKRAQVLATVALACHLILLANTDRARACAAHLTPWDKTSIPIESCIVACSCIAG